jgi:hypothetical protein
MDNFTLHTLSLHPPLLIPKDPSTFSTMEDEEEGVDEAWNVAKECQDDVQQQLTPTSTLQCNGEGRKDDGKDDLDGKQTISIQISGSILMTSDGIFVGANTCCSRLSSLRLSDSSLSDHCCRSCDASSDGWNSGSLLCGHPSGRWIYLLGERNHGLFTRNYAMHQCQLAATMAIQILYCKLQQPH